MRVVHKTAFRKHLGQADRTKQEQSNHIHRQIKQLGDGQHRLMDAIESGVLKQDSMIQNWVQEFCASQVEKLSLMLKTKFLNFSDEIAKGDLNLPLLETVVNTETLVIKVAYEVLLALTQGQ